MSVLDTEGCFEGKLTQNDKRELINLLMAKRGLKRNNHAVFSAEEIVAKAIETHGDKLSVGWSGGKCSTVALHMALQINPKIIVHYNNTGVEFPENVNYVHTLAKDWNLNYFEVTPKVNFWKDIVPKYGMPKLRNKNWGKRKDKKGFDKHKKPMCCSLLKEEPLKEFYAKMGIEAEIFGLRAAESRMRGIFVGQRGLIYYRKKTYYPLWLYMPVALWTAKQLDEYIKQNEIPHNPVYNTQTRNGCWPCTGYAKWKENLLRYSPKMYRFVSNKQGIMLIENFAEKSEVAGGRE